MYQNYIFDFYGTLVDIRTDEEKPVLWEKMSEIYRAMGADYGPDELKRAFRRLEEAERARVGTCAVSPGGGRQDEGARLGEDAEPDLTRVFALLYQEKNAVCDSARAKMTAVVFRALSREYLRVYDGVKELLGELRRRGKGVYLLSNAQTDFTRPEIDMLGLAGYFDGIFLSSEQGCKKPSPVFFRRLLERYGLKPSESVMIGNDEAADIAGARSAGMAALYIHTAISPREYGRVRADYRVPDGDFRKVGRLLLRPGEPGRADAELEWRCDMDFGKLTGYTVEGQKITLDFEGQKARVKVVTPRIINVFYSVEGAGQSSKAIEGIKTVPVQIRVEQGEDGLWIYTGQVSVRVNDGFYVDFFDRDGAEVCMDYRGVRRPLERVSPEMFKLLEEEGHSAFQGRENVFEVIKKLDPSLHFYGLGDKTGFLDKRHYEYEMWNTDNPDPHVDSFKALYKSIPFFIALGECHVYGIFLDNTFKSTFNMGQESEEYYWFGAEGGNLDYYYIAGDSLAEVLTGYTYLTGTCPLPQKWTLGYHQSRWGYVTWEDVEEVARGMRENDIPCDVIHFDIDYMQDYKVFTWNEGRYQNDSQGFLGKLAGEGFKVVVINDPGVKVEEGYEIYEEGVRQGYFARTPQGETYVNVVWPGEAVFPDFGSPAVRRWWGENQKFLLDKGVRGIWNDMNEPASFRGPLPDDVVFTDEDRETDHREMHNVYGHLMAKAAYEGLKKIDGRRPFVITRACYAGSQKYATAWTGDNNSLWAHLQMMIPQLCNLGLSGMPFVGTDVGGFGADTTPELLARWVEAGCFSPLFRNHSAAGTRRQEPWQFGPEVLDIYRKYVKLRYRLIPYLYDLFYQEEGSGAPIMRPLVYHFEKDETARVCNDEFMVGDRILAAPVVEQGMRRRMVYLPEGAWYDYWTHEKVAGPVWFVREAPLDCCPLYVRAGSILPVMEPQSYVGEKPSDTLLLEVYPGEGSCEHFLDNGEDFAYREGKYHQYHFVTGADGQVSGRVAHAGYDRPYRKILARRAWEDTWTEIEAGV